MISRRLLAGSTLTGAIFGLAGISATRSDASIRFIGRQRTIVALLDTGSERVIFVLGDRDDQLLADITGLTTIGNTRIDMVVASYRVLATQAAREHLRINSTTTISVQSNLSLPPIRGQVSPLTQIADITLGDATSMRLTPVTDIDEEAHFVADIVSYGVRIILAGQDGAVRFSRSSSCDLLAIPGRPDTRTVSNVHPQVLVCNSPNKDQISINQIQVFRTDPQVVRIGDGRISFRDDQLSS